MERNTGMLRVPPRRIAGRAGHWVLAPRGPDRRVSL